MKKENEWVAEGRMWTADSAADIFVGQSVGTIFTAALHYFKALHQVIELLERLRFGQLVIRRPKSAAVRAKLTNMRRPRLFISRQSFGWVSRIGMFGIARRTFI